jgi:single-strand DNA-binding protein
MLNQTVLVGRLVDTPTIEKNKEARGTKIKLAIPRSYKNTEGDYDTDFITWLGWGGIADNVTEYCKKGDLIGVKGRLEQQDNNVVVVAEKITFLSSKKE